MPRNRLLLRFCIFSLLLSLTTLFWFNSTAKATATGSPAQAVPPFSFQAEKNFTSGSTLTDFSTPVDLNKDGKLDLVFANNDASSIGILYGNGNATFQPLVLVPTASDPSAVTVVDIDGDTDLDFVVTRFAYGGNSLSSNQLQIFLNNGSGTFTNSVNYSLASGGLYPAVLADLNKDGKLDMMVPCNATDQIAVLLGNGNGTFAAPQYFGAGGTGPLKIELGDFNGDNNLDAAVATHTPGRITIFPGNGNGTFGAAIGNYTTNTRTYGFVVRDFNGDGKLDFLVPTGAPQYLLVYLGNGNGTFSPVGGASPVGSGTFFVIETADFNGDGKLDVVQLETTTTSRLSFFAGNGDGTFTFVFDCPVSPVVTRLSTGDFNGDNLPDVVTTKRSATLGIYLGGAAPQLSLSDGQVVEGNSGTRSLIFTATLNTTCCAVISATYATSNGTASVADNDYQAASGVITFSPGITSQNITVTVVGDTKPESSETFSVTMSGPVNAVLAKATGIGTITNDDISNPSPPPVNFGVVNYSSGGSNPHNNVLTDFNGDNKVDIAVVNRGSNTIGILLGNGDGTFQTAQTYSVSSSALVGLEAGDFDSDGDKDLVATSSWPGGSIYLLRNNGSGAFIQYASYVAGTDVVHASVADVNGDGKLDIVVQNYGSGSIGVFLNNGSGTFQPQVTYPSGGNNPLDTAIADFDGDNKPDIVVSNDLPSSNLRFLKGNGDGTFQGSVNIANLNGRVGVLDAVDVNGDGKLDLLTGAAAPTRIYVLLGNGNGTFNLNTPVVNTADWKYSVAADFNGDGLVDVGWIDYPNNKFVVLLGRGDGTFEFGFECTIPGVNAIRFQAADLNGDGRADMVISKPDSNNLAVVLNAPLPNLTISNGSVKEGNTGTVSAVFSVTLSNPCCQEVTVNYATSDGSATVADQDYVATSGTLTFAPGETTKTITVTVNGDTKIEPTETFSVTLSGPAHAVLAKATGVGTIINDDFNTPPPVNFGIVNYGSGGTSPHNNVIADFNGDNKPDIAVANRGTNNIGILLGNGDGTFQAAQSYTVSGSSLFGIEAGDFDSDGDKDLVVTSAFSGGNLYLLRNNGSGAFVQYATYPTASNPSYPSVGDVNGDGKLDIVVANNASGNLGVSLNNGNGTFQAQVTYPSGGINPGDTVIADFDSDNKPDIVVSNELSPSNLRFLKGNGDGTFQSSLNIANLNGRVTVLDAVDVNGDGKLDLLTGAAAPTMVYVLLGNGNGTFNLITPAVATTAPKYSATADFNADGLIDVAWLDYPNNKFVVLLGHGDGTFEFGFECTLPGTNAAYYRAADLNGDGRADMVISNPNLNNLAVVLNASPSAVSVADISLKEGNAGTTSAVFSVTLSNYCCKEVTVNYVTSDGSATVADQDYVATSGTLTFAPGETAKTITVTVNGDTKIEPTETFSVTLSGPVNAVLAKATGVGTIINDDFPPPPPVNFGIVNYGSGGTSPQNTTIVDFNGDNKPDIAVANRGTNNVGILLGNGDGTFQPVQSYASGNNSPTGALLGLEAGDFDSDGDKDLVVTSAFNFGGGSLYLLRNNGSGAFTPYAQYSVGFDIVNPSVADLNGDAKLDIVAADNANGSLSVFLNNGTGTFQPAQSYAAGGTKPADTVVADFDGDNRPDIIVSNDAPSSNLRFLKNNGNGTFQSSVNIATVNGRVTVVSAADVDGDGKLDLLMAAAAPTWVYVLLGNGNGTFNLITPLIATTVPKFSTVADFNADGLIDVAWLDYPNNKFVVLLGHGDGTFEFGFECTIPGANAGYNPAADLNGDGRADMVIANPDLNNLAVILNVPTPVVNVSDVSLQEGNAGTATAVFSVTLSNSCCKEVSVKYATSDVGATIIDQDYGATSGTLTFASGETAKTITVTVTGDTKGEQAETFRLNLCGAVNATIGKGIGLATILNDDAGPVSPPLTASQGVINYYSGGCNPEITTLSDFNNDGKIDIAAANSNSSNVGILIGNGDGTFQPAAVYTGGPQPFAIKAGDLDGDNDQDLVVTGAFSGTQVYIMRNSGGGVFQYLRAYTVEGNPARHEVLDVNGDGKLDIVVPNKASGTISVLLGNGDATFQAQLTFASGGANPSDIATGDFNGDGKIDLAVVNDEPASNLVFLLGNGNGTFQSPSSVFNLNGRVTMVDRQDLNGDGKLDVVVTAGLPARAYIFLNNGTGTFTQLTPANTTPTPKESILADFNADMKTDILWLDYPNNKFVVLIGKGDGTFDFGFERTVPDNVTHINAADINADGKSDVVTSNYNSSNLSVILTVQTPTTVNVSDATVVEGNANSTTLVFSVNLTVSTEQNVTVSYATQDGTATIADNDYSLASGVITFTPGQTAQLVMVTVWGDTKVENNEHITLNLSNSVNATMGRNKAVGLIINDDAVVPCNPFSVTAISDDGSGTVCGTLSYALSQPAANSLTISFALTTGNTITFTGNANLTVKSGVTVDGGSCNDNLPIILDGTGVNGNGLTLSGNNSLRNMWIKGFATKQLEIAGWGNQFQCSKVSRS